MRLTPAALALAALLAAGCLGSSSSPVKVAAYWPLNDAQPERGTEFAFFVESTSAFKQDLAVRAADLPQGWGFEPESASLSIPGFKTTSLIVRFTPGPNASYGPRTIGVLVGDTRADVVVDVRDLQREPARAGVGAQVYYALWHDNGTLIESNDPVARDRPGLAWARLGNETPDYRPLKVYVGGQRGTPPPEPYNSTGCEGGDPPPCYHPVIPGFDARLRDAGRGQGMVGGETLAGRVPKEQAYTYAGNEKHPLYGENLNFLIRVLSVDVYNVRSCDLPVCPPT